MTVASTLLDDRYLLDEEIGSGGFCEVWRATDSVLTRPVAVKLLHAAFAHQPEAQARFKAEARHAGALSHENVARVYDYGEPEPGQSYLVMELIEGPCLATVLADGPLDAARTMDIVAQVAAGLQAAHSAGLVHRDIKPANIMITAEGTVLITDFGVAHSVSSTPLTATGMMVGSPGYIAPERVAGSQGGPASDLYALGIVAYECLAGARPFAGPPLEVAIAHRDRQLPPLPAWVPAEVTSLVMMLTAKDPAWRPASAGEVARRARWLQGQLLAGTIGARPAVGMPSDTAERKQAVPSRTRARRPGRRLPLYAAVVTLTALTCLVLLTVAGLAAAGHPGTRSPRAVPSGTAPVPTGSPVAARLANQHPSATPGASTSELAAGGHTPGTPPGHEKGPAEGGGPPTDRGHGPGGGNPGRGNPGHGNPGHGHGHGAASGLGAGEVLAAARNARG